MIGHHVMHGGYSKEKGRYHRRTFARGVQARINDWLDWMLPEAWDVEHNKLHHYQLNEDGDPDLIERNMEDIELRDFAKNGVSRVWGYAAMFAMACIWKWAYYAPNTLKEYANNLKDSAENKNKKLRWSEFGEKPATAGKLIGMAVAGNIQVFVDFLKCVLPYAFFMFVLVPGATYVLLGAQCARTALYASLFADVATNIHSFIIIACNHAGDDLYRFATPVTAKSDEFMLRAVIGSANFHTGFDFGAPGSFKADLVDFMQGWLNYQIEHHMFPDMSML